MGRIEKSVEIKAPPEKVWEMLALDRMPEWKENCRSAMFTSEVHTPEDKYKVGATARFIDKHSKLMMTITDSLENEKITYRSSYSFVHRIDLTYALELVEKGTKLTYVVNYEMISWGGSRQDPLQIDADCGWKRGRELVREPEKHSGEIDAH